MKLHDYKKKREFSQTPEPRGTLKKNSGPLTFVVQKHQATQLHYDFRLELDGVLKSWAVPKGPSLNTKAKHLAMMVEDHPLDYASFEGIIPKGNYGAGIVMVWDKGVYSPIAAVDRQGAEDILNDQLAKGHLTFIMLGEKLQGEFALVKIHNAEKNAWLLIKAGDEYASKKDILLQDHSVLTGRSLEEIAKQAAKKQEVWFSKPKSLDLTAIPKGQMPYNVKPMLAQAVAEPFDRHNWIFELKYDGYRAIAEIESGIVKLYSRNHLSYNEKFSLVAQSLTKFPGDVVLDGEIVVVDTKGHPHFQWLQDYPKEKHGELIYYVFDILYYAGHDLTSLPLLRRKEFLKQVLPPLPHIVYADHIEETGIAMFQQANKLGLEGIMAKNGQSEYKLASRTNDWLKIKTHLRQETVIAGFTNPRGGRKYFGALVLGIYKQGKLHYIGHTGGGFDQQTLKNIFHRLQPLAQKACPFATEPETNAPVTWVEPVLIAEVTFSNWTKDGQMRQPVFLGLREDKKAAEVEQEAYFSQDPLEKEGKELMIDKQKLTLTNLAKIFWPQEKYTKGDLIDYYREIAALILPYLKDRPESLLRYPNGITGNSFFQKDSSTLDASWIKRIMIHSDSGEKDIEYLLCQDEATLVYLINLGCIDLNPWSSRIKHLDKPDYLIIDLDPENTNFSQVIKVAQAARDVLEKLAIESYCKTSGATGLHIYIPMGAKYTYEQTRKLAELLCIQIHNKIPQITSLKRNPKDRQGLVYLDYLQNIRGQTLASVYSVRAQPGATVSTPLLWSEVTVKLHPSQYTIKNVPHRIQKHGDLFDDVLGKGIDLEKVLKNLEHVLGDK